MKKTFYGRFSAESGLGSGFSSVLRKTRLAAALAVVLPVFAAGFSAGALASTVSAPEGITSDNPADDEWSLNDADSATPAVTWASLSNYGFTVTGDVVINNTRFTARYDETAHKDFNPDNPIVITIAPDSSLTLNGFYKEGPVLSVINGLTLEIVGDGTGKLITRDDNSSASTSTPYTSFYSTAGAKLIIRDLSLDLQGQKGMRAEDGGVIKITEASYVYVGYNPDDDTTSQAFRGIVAVNGSTDIEIDTDEMKVYSQGLTISKDNPTSLIVTAAMEGNAEQLSALSSKPATIRIHAKNLDLKGVGGQNASTSYAVYSYATTTATTSFDSLIDLTGDTFTLTTDWATGLYSRSTAARDAALDVDFDDYIVMNFKDASVNQTKALYSSSEAGGGTASITLNAGDYLTVNDPYNGAYAYASYGTSKINVSADTVVTVNNAGYAGIYAYASNNGLAKVDFTADRLEFNNNQRAAYLYGNGGTSDVYAFAEDILIDSDAASSYGIFVYSAKSGSSNVVLTATDDITVSTVSNAVYARAYSNSAIKISLTSYDTMSLASSGASTLYACSGSGRADIELKAEYVTVSGNDSANGDFYVFNRDAAAGNTISVKGTISLTDEKAGGIIAEATGANSLISLQSASLDLKDSSGYIAKATKSGVIRLNYDAASDSYIAGNASHLEGALSAASAEIYAGLDGTDTTFTGSADDGSFKGRSGAGKITVKAANGALWTVKPFNPEGTSSVFSNLWLYNSSGTGKRGITSTVDLTATETAQDLYITNLTGAGAEFVLRTQVDANRTGSFRDHVIVGSGEGSHFILVKAVGLASEDANDWTEEVQADYLVAHYEKNGATSQALTLDSSGKVVAAAASGASPLAFSLANANGEVDYGNYRYVLQTREITDKDGVTGTEWYLRRAGAPTENDDTFTEDPDCTGDGCNKPDEEEKEPDPSCTGDNCGTGDTPKEDTPTDETPKDETPKDETPSTFERTPDTTTAQNQQNQSFKNLSSSAQLASTLAGYGTMYSAWNANLTTLRKRLGEVRYGAQEGVWTRFIWQKDKTDGMTGGRFEQKLKGLQIGADHIVAQNEDRMWLVGANFKYAKGDQKVKGMTKGEGDMDAYGAFLYATYANYKGYYTDLVLSLDHYTEKMRAQQTDYTMTRGSFNTWGWGASVEAGRMFSSTQSEEGWGPWYANWWIEPQVQLSYYTGKGQNFTMSNGMTVDQKNGQSLVGRAGVVAGRKFNSPEDRTMVTKDYSQFYIKGGVKHEFLGKETVRLNGERFSGNLKGTRVYYGAGVDDSDEDLRFYAQFEREHGSKYQKDAEVSFGVKVEF